MVSFQYESCHGNLLVVIIELNNLVKLLNWRDLELEELEKESYVLQHATIDSTHNKPFLLITSCLLRVHVYSIKIKRRYQI